MINRTKKNISDWKNYPSTNYEGQDETTQSNNIVVEEYIETSNSKCKGHEEENGSSEETNENDKENDQGRPNDILNLRNRSKKHDVDISSWKKNMNNVRREKGLDYTGKRKYKEKWSYDIPKSKKILTNPCTCKIKNSSQKRKVWSKYKSSTEKTMSGRNSCLQTNVFKVVRNEGVYGSQLGKIGQITGSVKKIQGQKRTSGKKPLSEQEPECQSLNHSIVVSTIAMKIVLHQYRRRHSLRSLTRKTFRFIYQKKMCDICVAYDTRNIGQEEYALHQEMKKEAREEQEQGVRFICCSFYHGLGGSIAPSKINCKQNAQDGHCVLWHEAEGSLTANEFSSILCSFLESAVIPNLPNDNKIIILYSDGCTGQNRNSILANAFVNLCMLHEVTIIQKYLEKGHAQMEVDSMHSCIEKKIRNRKINIPAD
nr:unnamed protein product [Callosobruchus analis]